MFGIVALQSLKASRCRLIVRSALKAKLCVEITEVLRAMASTKPAWRILLVKEAVIVISCGRAPAGPLFR